MTTPVTLLLFDGCDLMDVVGPYEVLLTASRLQQRAGGEPLVSVCTVSVDGHAVTAFGGMTLVPSHGSVGDLDDVGVLVVPGMIDLDGTLADAALVATVRDLAARATLTTSVCTGSFLLDKAGVLGDLPATTHWEDVPALAARRPGAATRDDVRWVDAGDVVTAGGISSGIDMALHLVERLADRELAEATARQVDHVWRDTR